MIRAQRAGLARARYGRATRPTTLLKTLARPMLQAIRSKVTGLVAKIFFVFLALVFGVWGSATTSSCAHATSR